MLTLHLLLLLAAPPSNQKPSPSAVPAVVNLKKGEQRLSPLKHANRCTCDNRNVADGVLIDGRIELRGIGPGTTKCSLAGTDGTKSIQVTIPN